VIRAGPPLLQVVMLLEHLHGHPLPEVVRLELGYANQPAVRLADPADVLAVQRLQAPQAAPPRPGDVARFIV
jgi:hypothetical protein